jgi:hypothetical protein
MRSLVVLFALGLAPMVCSAEVPPCFLGRWKSDEARTVADLRTRPELPDTARALLENNFFGRLVLIFGSRYIGSYFEGQQHPEDASFERVDVVASGPSWLTLRYRVAGKEIRQNWACEGGRIYSVATQWGIREYFTAQP